MTTDNNSTTFSCITVNTLEEISFIASTYYKLIFTILDENGNPLNLNGANTQWLLSPYGDPTNTVLQKTGTITDVINGVFEIVLEYADTINLSGKYIHQPVIIDSALKDFRLAQGIINITRAIPYE